MATNARTIEEVLGRLLQQRGAYQHRLVLLKAELFGATASQNLEGTSTNHPADSSSDAYLAETDVTSIMEMEHELVELDGALRRIEHGTYGQCVDCGDQIDPARLAARPSAARCLRCQSKWESRPGHEHR